MSSRRVKFNIETARCGVKIKGGVETCDRQAVVYCKTCAYFICESCMKSHRKLVAIKNHILLNRDHVINPDLIRFVDSGLHTIGNDEESVHTMFDNFENAKSKIHDESLDAYDEYRSRVLKLLFPPEDAGDGDNIIEEEQQTDKFSFTEPCSRHEGMVIMFFCESHLQLCCAICKQDEHRGCSSHLKFIPDELPSDKICQTILSGLAEQIHIFKEQDKNYQCDLKQLKKSKDTFLHDLKGMKRKVLDWLNLMEVRAVRRLDIVYDKCRKGIEAQRQHSREYIEKLRAEMYFLKGMLNRETCDGVNMFIKSKKADEFVRCTSLQNKRQYTNTRFSLKLNTDFDQVKNEINHLYELHFEIKGEDKFNVRLRDDAYKCNVTGCAVLPNEDFVLTDRANSRVKHFDKFMKPLASLVMDDGVFDVTIMDATSVAVTTPITNKVKVIELAPEIAMLREIQVGSGTCWGITFHKDTFFVNVSTDDMSSVRVINDNSEKIVSEVVTKCSVHSAIRNSQTNQCSELVSVVSFVEGEHADLIHYKVEHEMVLPDEMTCHVTKICEYNFLNHLYTWGLEIDHHGNPVVCCKDTDQIYTIHRNGNEAELLLAESDGVCRPQSLCYNPAKDKLLVTSENTDFIQMFKFEK